jgi:hypothetical protein
MLSSLVAPFVLLLSLTVWTEGRRNYEFDPPIPGSRRPLSGIVHSRTIVHLQLNEDNYRAFRMLESLSYSYESDKKNDKEPDLLDLPIKPFANTSAADNVTLVAKSSAALEEGPVTSVKGSFQSAGIFIGVAGLVAVLVLVSPLLLVRRHKKKPNVQQEDETLDVAKA